MADMKILQQHIYLPILFSLSCLICPLTRAQLTVEEGETISKSLANEGRAAVDRSVKWLLSKQNKEGYWSNNEFPALTGLPLWALCRAGLADTPEAKKAAEWVASCAREDGSIYVDPNEKRKGGGLVNYNTAICMTALHATGNPKYVPLILKARTFVAGSQHLGDDIYKGGMGYDASTGRAYADLLNTSYAITAMRETESVEDFRKDGEKRADLNWDEIVKFIEKNQNDPKFNKSVNVSDDPREQGGFFYRPDQTRAGTHEGKDGTLRFRSMPGMSYAGLLSYIYADVDRDDPRVAATIRWVANNWNLDVANRDPEKQDDPAAAQEGLFYLYNIKSKGLSVFGQDTLLPENGKAFNWRVQLIERLLRVQKTDAETGNGYWVNEVSRYWESDPVLVTSYTLIALENALGELLDAK